MKTNNNRSKNFLLYFSTLFLFSSSFSMADRTDQLKIIKQADMFVYGTCAIVTGVVACYFLKKMCESGDKRAQLIESEQFTQLQEKISLLEEIINKQGDILDKIATDVKNPKVVTVGSDEVSITADEVSITTLKKIFKKRIKYEEKFQQECKQVILDIYKQVIQDPGKIINSEQKGTLTDNESSSSSSGDDENNEDDDDSDSNNESSGKNETETKSV